MQAKMSFVRIDQLPTFVTNKVQLRLCKLPSLPPQRATDGQHGRRAVCDGRSSLLRQ